VPNSTSIAKPRKPYPDFPLYAHASGRWAKKIRQRTFFFGYWDDWKGALERYLDERDAIQAGRNPRSAKPTTPTLQELVNVYVNDARQRVASNDLSQRTLNDYIKTLKRLATIRSKHEFPSEWTPLDFAQIKEEFAKPVKRSKSIRGGLKGPKVKRRAATTVDIDIRCIKAFLNWCSDTELIPEPRFGKSFSLVSAKAKRLRKAAVGPRDYSAVEVKQFIDASTVWFRCIVLLGINGGFGASDIAQITVEDYQGEWLDFARRKTGFERKVWLWPETRAAIDEQLSKRRDLKPEDLLFVTKYRKPWMRDTHDAIGKLFQQIRDKHLWRGSFYDLRRTFQTIAEESLDFPAVKYVMGHSALSSDMSAVYRQRISDDRVKRVCEHVRGWVYANA
jgi:integrase